MTSPSKLPKQAQAPWIINLFSPGLRIGWLVVFVLVTVLEGVPRPSLTPLPYYSYTTIKAIVFLLLGFLTPLTFWPFDTLGRALLSSVAIAGLVELLQSFSAGHRASFVEFGAKLVLLFAGFASAVVARDARQIKVANLIVSLVKTRETHKP